MKFTLDKKTRLTYCVLFTLLLAIVLCFVKNLLIIGLGIICYAIAMISVFMYRDYYEISDNQLIIVKSGKKKEIPISEIPYISRKFFWGDASKVDRSGRRPLDRTYMIINGSKVSLDKGMTDEAGRNVFTVLTKKYKVKIKDEGNYFDSGKKKQ